MRGLVPAFEPKKNAYWCVVETLQDIRVDDAKDADFFFVPIYGECFLWSHEMLRKEPHAVAFGATNQFFLEAMSIVRGEYQWWNRTNGRDHVFVFAG